MYALVINNNIEKIFTYPKGFELNGNQYPTQLFTKWSKAQKEAIGIYEVVTDSTNLKDTEYYINTNEQFAFANGAVTRSWGTATAKQLADSLWTQQDSDDGLLPSDKEVGDVKVEGLKTIKKRMIKQQASGILTPSDWIIIRAKETATNIPSATKTWRASVRTKSNEMETAIDGAADVDALKALFTYTEQEDGTVTRPLGEFPEE